MTASGATMRTDVAVFVCNIRGIKFYLWLSV